VDNEGQIDLQFSHHETAYLIEALHDAIIRRVKWVVDPEMEAWRQKVDLPIIQHVINAMVQMYGVALQTFRDSGAVVHADFVSMMEFPSEFWDQINSITLADNWSEVTYHAEHGDNCPVCVTIEES
jgi:hypothetical protein